MTEEKFAFTMRLNAGMQAEYKRRHDAIWPALSQALTEAGVRDYSIHLDPETDILFAVLWRRTDHGLDALATTEIMQEWWAFMAAPVAKPIGISLFRTANPCTEVVAPACMGIAGRSP
jgi:L-rhamnose mutarotase